MKTNTPTSRTPRNVAHREEQLKDRRDYRQALIQKRNELEGKIAAVEAEIAQLKD